jgi:hypothetical protein
MAIKKSTLLPWNAWTKSPGSVVVSPQYASSPLTDSLFSDYIGNTVVQRFFEKCSEDTKTLMLRHIGPHLAAGGVHKNGTWAVQKIIDNIKTPEQVSKQRYIGADTHLFFFGRPNLSSST